MKKLKKTICILLLIVCSFQLIGCTDKKEQTPNEYINNTVDPSLQNMTE